VAAGEPRISVDAAWVDHAPLWYFELDAGDRVVVSGGAAASARPDAPVPLAELVTGASWPQIESALQTARAGAPASVAFSAPPGEAPRVFEGVLAQDGGGSVICVAVDVTDRVRAQRAQAIGESRLRQVIDLVPQFIFAKDEAGRFILANQAVADAYGTRIEDLIGRTDADFNSNPEEVEHFRRDDLEVIQGGRAKVIAEERITDARGDVRYLATTKIPYTLSGSTARALLGVAVDITERKRAEEDRAAMAERLRTTQHLEELGALAGSVAHDFNNRLLGIIGHADLSLLALGDRDDEVAERLSAIIATAEQAAEQCRQLLAFSGRGNMLLRKVDINALVLECVADADRGCGDVAGVEVRLDPCLPLMVGDPAQLRQVIANLLDNARDAVTDCGGWVRISTGTAKPDAPPRGKGHSGLQARRWLSLTVEDGGCGIDDAVHARLFEPFFTTKEARRGLGLAAVQGIVRAHGGTVRVDRPAEGGSRFEVLFPPAEDSAQPPAPPPAALAKSRRRARPRRALVVDDDPTVRLLSKAILERDGYAVELACDGVEGVDRFRNLTGRLDVVLLDMTMPRMNGAQAYEAMSAIDPSVPVVITSGYNESEAIACIGASGPAGFIQKPYRAAELLGKIASLQAAPPDPADRK
jgi:PAS domain S-box-containing protein